MRESTSVSTISPSVELFRSDTTRFGTFRCPPGDALWRSENTISDGDNVVFPRTFVEIRASGYAPVVSGPTTTMFYHRGQTYERGLVSPDGDACEWIMVDPGVMQDLLEGHGPHLISGRRDRVRSNHWPSDAKAYLLQRAVYCALQRPDECDHLAIEESLLDIVRRQAAAAIGGGRRAAGARGPGAARRDAELVDTVRKVFAARFRAPLTLTQLAKAAGCSVFHLCRVYRAAAGAPIHRDLRRTRLRAALEAMAETATPLAAISLDAGFASQSHFTDAFRAEFGEPPARVRRRLRA